MAVVGNISHWNQSNPIPTDPCYQQRVSARPSSASKFHLKGPIGSDPGLDSARSTRSSIIFYYFVLNFRL